MTMNQHRHDIKIELYRGDARKPTATVGLDYRSIARQSNHALVERIATELAGGLQKGEYRLFFSEIGKEPISRQWRSVVDVDDKFRFRELRQNTAEIVRDWRVTQASR